MFPLALHRRTIAVVVPAHDEADTIDRCLRSIEVAASVARGCGYHVLVFVVCDACGDATADIAARRGHRVLEIAARSVGAARALGARTAILFGADWLAFTDADSEVSPGWLLDQLALASDVVCGTVSVHDWTLHDASVRRRYEARYEDRDEHRHVHGANLGMAAGAYHAVGGFDHVERDEDVGIVAALARAGAQIAWSARPRVATSARLTYRAPGGFGAYMVALVGEAA